MSGIRGWFMLLALIFVCFIVWTVLNRLSDDAVAMLVGLIVAIVGMIPIAMIVMAAGNRRAKAEEERHRRREERFDRMLARQQQYPPPVVMLGGMGWGAQEEQQYPPPPPPLPQLEDGQYTVVDGSTEW